MNFHSTHYLFIIYFFILSSSMAVGDEDAAKKSNENGDNEDEDLYDWQLYLDLYCTIFETIMFYIWDYNILYLKL